MPTLEGLRRTIETATDLGSVVTTMKTLAAVSIRQYETAVDALADYNRTIELGFRIVLHHEPFRAERVAESKKVGVIVFGTDQGMCGQFNEEIVSFVRERQKKRDSGRRWMLLVVGLRAEGLLRDSGFFIDHTCQVPTSVSDVTNLVQELLPQVERWQAEFNVTQLEVFYNRRTSASSFEPQQLQLLPIDPARFRQWSQEPWQSRSLPTFSMDRNRLLSRLIRQYVFVSLFRACAESLASENASRIAAMQAAEKNIEQRLDELQLAFNHHRQTAITEELLDVVTGFEALEHVTNQPHSR